MCYIESRKSEMAALLPPSPLTSHNAPPLCRIYAGLTVEPAKGGEGSASEGVSVYSATFPAVTLKGYL